MLCVILMSDRFFSFQNNQKNLDPSYEMDLDFLGLFGKEKNLFKTIPKMGLLF